MSDDLSLSSSHEEDEPVAPEQYIDKPADCDVLIGRGGLTLNHPGNVEFRRLVEERKPLYKSSKRPVKHLVATEIVQKIHEQGGRFVKRRRDGWYEVLDKIAQSKAMHALRDKKKTRPYNFAQQESRRLYKIGQFDNESPEDDDDDDEEGEHDEYFHLTNNKQAQFQTNGLNKLPPQTLFAMDVFGGKSTKGVSQGSSLNAPTKTGTALDVLAEQAARERALMDNKKSKPQCAGT